jgi:hypothetical protein
MDSTSKPALSVPVLSIPVSSIVERVERAEGPNRCGMTKRS